MENSGFTGRTIRGEPLFCKKEGMRRGGQGG
jgi:hypothetical protein